MEESFGEILGWIFALDDIGKYCERFKSFKIIRLVAEFLMEPSMIYFISFENSIDKVRNWIPRRFVQFLFLILNLFFF